MTTAAPAVGARRRAAQASRALPADSRAVTSLRATPRRTPEEIAQDEKDIRTWRTRNSNEHTERSYKRESDRLRIWMNAHRPQTCLRDLEIEDLQAFAAWLTNPPESLIRTRGPNGAPPVFMDKLSPASARLSLRIIGGLFRWLHAAGKLPRNAMVLGKIEYKKDKRALGDGDDVPVETKAIRQELWDRVVAHLDAIDAELPTTGLARTSFERQRAVVLLLYYTGLRRDELGRAMVKDLGRNRDGYFLRVIGKGDKRRLVPVIEEAANVIARLWSLEGRSLAVYPHDSSPLIPSRRQVDAKHATAASSDAAGAPRSRGHLTTVRGSRKPSKIPRAHLVGSSVGRLVSQLLTRIAARIKDEGDVDLAEELQERAKAHRLRHTFGTHFAQRGGSALALQQNLGHSDPRTTAHYINDELARRQEETQRIMNPKPRIDEPHARIPGR